MNKKNILILILLLLAALALACNLSPNQSSKPPETQSPTEEAGVLPTKEPVSSTSQSENQPTEAPAQPTEAPPEPTAEPTKETSGEMQTLCYNDFYPVREGVTYTYRTDTLGKIEDMTVYFKEVTEDSFDAVTTFPEFSSEVKWLCTNDGMVSLSNAQFSMPDVAGFDIGNIDYKGVTLPNPDQWEVGLKWGTYYAITSTVTMQGIESTVISEVKFSNKIPAIQEVTVPAGTYPDAYLVESKGTITTYDFSKGLRLGETVTNFSQKAWYVRNVGLIKNISTMMDTTSTMELVSTE